jgi:very-short-patch-repair endonuclease
MEGFRRVRGGWEYWDRAIAAVAAGQHGLIRVEQLHALGLSSGAIEHRVRAGRLHPIHRGVYAVGHSHLTSEGRWLAAVYAAWPDAVLSHRSAAGLWHVEIPAFELAEITTSTGRRPGRGILAHEGRLSPAETTHRSGIPVTAPLRTVIDLAAVAGRRDARRAYRVFETRRLITAEALNAAVTARPRRRGNAALRAILLDAGYGKGITRSEMEARFNAFLRRHRLPKPQRNALVSAGPIELEVDFVWRDARVIAELDGRTFHDTASAFERDRERDRALAVHGWRVIRITWRQLHDDAPQLARDLRALLARTPANP